MTHPMALFSVCQIGESDIANHFPIEIEDQAIVQRAQGKDKKLYRHGHSLCGRIHKIPPKLFPVLFLPPAKSRLPERDKKELTGLIQIQDPIPPRHKIPCGVLPKARGLCLVNHPSRFPRIHPDISALLQTRKRGPNGRGGHMKNGTDFGY